MHNRADLLAPRYDRAIRQSWRECRQPDGRIQTLSSPDAPPKEFYSKVEKAAEAVGKRPGRKDYDAGENPRDQVEGYVMRLLAGGEVDVDGRPIKLTRDTTFYCYIVADDVGRMSEWTRTWGVTPDGRGRFYEPSNGFKGRVELLGWDALIGDARERHKAFFDRAGIPGNNIFKG